MEFLHNILTVAKYEAKILRRSWFFRLFALGALFIFTLMNIGMFSPVGGEPWTLVSIPSSVPLINLYLLNIGQSLVVIFLAADFLKRDKKVDTNEVLYTRSISNLEYILGKTWGILRLFLGLDIIILSIGLLMNIISKSMSVDLMAYLSYLLIICIPTLLFSLGLAFLMMSVIRNQPLTFLLLLGFAALDIFYLWFRMGSIFDYMAFGIPIFKSGMVGFDNADYIINQRLIYFFLGSAFVLATVLFFHRLPQSVFQRYLTFIFLFIFLISAGYNAYNTYSTYSEGIRLKNLIIETNRQFESSYFAVVTDASIEIDHNGKTLNAISEIKIRNDNRAPLEKYIFSLNPSLKVINISSNRNDLKYVRNNHIIEIEPLKSLEAGHIDSLFISYEGGISEAFCYPDHIDNIKDNPYRMEMVNVNKRQAFLEEGYVLLTPETHWYPVSALNYYPTNPARIKIDFTRYSLRVKDKEGMIPVSQGVRSTLDGFSIFTPESPLTGLTLAIGNYVTDTLKVDSVQYISYHYPGNDYYKKDLAELKDTVKYLISGIMRDLESNFSIRYPFSTLSLVEVPVQYYSYTREATQTRAEVQPSLVLLPEKLSTLENAGFSKRFSWHKKRMEKNNQVVTDKELLFRLLNSFLRDVFIDGVSSRYNNGLPLNEPVRYRLGPSFYFFKNNFYSSEYPVINAVFETHLQKINMPEAPGPSRRFSGMVSDNDRANLIFKDLSLNEILKKDPSGDSIRIVLSVKGDYFFNLLRSEAGIGEFDKWFSKYLHDNRFRNIDIIQLDEDIKHEFGFSFYPSLKEWFYGKGQPGFLFKDLKASEIIIDNRSKYQVTFIVSNPEPVAGLFNITFRTGGPGARRGAGQMMMGNQGGRGPFSAMAGSGIESPDIYKIVLLDAMKAKRIGVLLDFQPRAMIINTLYSKNVPGQITMPIGEMTKTKNLKPFDGDELIPLPGLTDPGEIIVDNEDDGFSSGLHTTISPLRKILRIRNEEAQTYQQLRFYNFPEHWQPVVGNTYFGKYILSSVYTRAGTGDRSVTWTTPIKEPGYYDVFSYIGKAVDRMTVRRAGAPAAGGSGRQQGQEGEQNFPGPRMDNMFKEMHYKIYHDEGVDEITIDYEKAEGGWNTLGRFYFSADTAKVELTNQSSGRIVIGDAIRWVRNE